MKKEPWPEPKWQEKGAGLIPVMALLGFLGIFGSIWVTKFASGLKSQKRYTLDFEISYLKDYLGEQIHCSDTLARARELHGISTNSQLCSPGNRFFFPIYRSTFEGPSLPLGSLANGVQNSTKVGDWWVRGQCLWDTNNPERTTLMIRVARPKVAPGSTGFQTDPLNNSKVLDWQNDKLILFGDPTQDSTLDPICQDTIPRLSGGANATLLGFNVGMISTRTRLDTDELGKIYDWYKTQCDANVNQLKSEKNYIESIPLSRRTTAQKARLNALKGTNGLISTAQKNCDNQANSFDGPRKLAGYQRLNPSTINITNQTQRAGDPPWWPPEVNYVDFDLPLGTSMVELDISGQWQGTDDLGIDIISSIMTIELSSSTSSAGKYYGTQMIKIGSDIYKSRSVRFLPTQIGSDIPASNIRTIRGAETQWSTTQAAWANNKFLLPMILCLTSSPCQKIRYVERIPNHTTIPSTYGQIKNSPNDGKAYWWSTVTAKFFGS